MDISRLAMQFAPMILKAINEKGVLFPPIESFLEKGYDPGLMLDAVQQNDVDGYQKEFLNLNTANPSDYLNPYGSTGIVEGGLTPELNPTEFSNFMKKDPKKLNTLYAEALRQEGGPATAAMSAYSMLNKNPLIGIR